MKKISNWAILALISLSSCTHEFNYDPTQEVKENAESIFGLIDSNQDWCTITSGTVSITADADLSDIAKVQILTESPFFNENAQILAEADVTAGETVSLDYDAPRGTETLIAACVDSKGHHFIKPFSLNAKQVSFSTSANTRALTRAADNIDVSGWALNGANTIKSLNALRNIYANLATIMDDDYMKKFSSEKHIDIWENGNWEYENLWELADNSQAGTWNIVNGAVVREIGAISEDEKAIVKAIFDKYLAHAVGNVYSKQYDNMKYIRNASAVRFFNSHLTSDGSPISIIPVQMASKDLPLCDLYYYYYDANKIPKNISTADYIKQLPKFKAIPCKYTREAAGVASNPNGFFKKHEYLLPYYGDSGLLDDGVCTPVGGVCRIRNGRSANNYLTYLDACGYYDNKIRAIYDDNHANIENQLWQVFKTTDNKYVLYNIGAKKFLTGVGTYLSDGNSWATFFTDYLPVVKELAFEGEVNLDGSPCKFWIDEAKTKFLGANTSINNLRIATNKTANDGVIIDWYLEPFNSEQKINKLESLTLEGTPLNKNVVSASIPAGYRVGFMLRKVTSPLSPTNRLQGYLKTVNNGCVYGNGELNTVINNFPGHFNESLSKYTMDENDTRIAMFNANNKTYLAFEDGNDCNYSDMIIEIVGNSGRLFDDVQEVKGQSFTMCFEDRPKIADYDMNDVVLRCTRLSETELELSLVATGANDLVYISGIAGDYVSGTDLNNKEVHELFGVPTSTFVNTEPSAETLPAISCVYKVDSRVTMTQFLSDIFIKNYSYGGNEIHVPVKGEPPYALILPMDFNYPAERISIANAYTTFRNWVNNANNYGNWPEFYDSSKIYINPYNR